MNLHPFGDWLAATSLSQAIQASSWAIPGIQTIHILCIAALFACALMFSLRIAGRGLAAEPLRSVGARMTHAIWTLLAALLFTGILMITAEPSRTITNPVFYTKMLLLSLAIIVTAWLASVARRESVELSALHVAGAVVAMVLWVGIIFAGRYIAYVESY